MNVRVRAHELLPGDVLVESGRTVTQPPVTVFGRPGGLEVLVFTDGGSQRWPRWPAWGQREQFVKVSRSTAASPAAVDVPVSPSTFEAVTGRDRDEIAEETAS
jgi:hypothetical protein